MGVRRNQIVFLAAILTIFFLTAGCGKVEEANGFKPLGNDEQAKIKVLFYNDQAFHMLYGSAFSAKYPNIEVEVVSSMPLLMSGNSSPEELYKLIAEEKPDVLFLDEGQYEQLAWDGQLLSLETFVREDKFDLEQLHQPVVDLLKAKGNGMLFGLTPTFNTNALFFNKDLFDQYGVPYPTHQMSWDEVLMLAGRFSMTGNDEERVYGFAASGSSLLPVNGYMEMFNSLAATEGLQMISDDKKLTMNTEAMKATLQTVIDAYRSGAVRPYKPPEFDPDNLESIFLQDPFIAGKAAMTVNNYSFISSLRETEKHVEGYEPFAWEVVTEPVNPSDRSRATAFYLGQILSIRADSESQAAAWELVKYINSEEFARVQTKIGYELPARSAYAKEQNEALLEAFYRLTPSLTSAKESAGISWDFYNEFNAMANEEILAVINNQKSIEEALEAMEEQGQWLLDKMKE